ncbi:glycine zipper 2TM domain-containing protein [Xanthomonas campestris pv. incanae]|uniref:glycine zipper 2TM domain-containing protein n=1 Tax=Xanthomonas TaxID=338 RepID=UPI0005AF0016|nr:MULTISPECIES: glycine zipper 2TM domain-containing protein [Xanthomonas]KIQ26332.1 membrane protein [Xanthomonas campestris]MDX6082777.1 glycine zipper 2TM domain-containing protein [Xanthomonas campestris pv. incanae]MDX6085505.1 glycine zipper 2TM domain-containing protein [Xanthomonas campestris pv. incanae]MDX6140768.1 glycine zipper 2TM domain-containing protein [Xanthomonas campestris pv. incanae]
MKMHTSLMGMSLIALMATSTFAQAQNYSQHRYTTADDGTRVRCKNVEVQKNSRDPNRIAGTATGAIVGGLLGNQVGGGNGKKAATVLGAVAGGAAGRTIQGNSQQNNGDRRVERVCERR